MTAYISINENDAISESYFDIIFLAKVSYVDPYYQLYVDKGKFPYGNLYENIEDKLERKASVSTKINLKFDIKDPPNFHIDPFYIEADQPIGVSVRIR